MNIYLSLFFFFFSVKQWAVQMIIYKLAQWHSYSSFIQQDLFTNTNKNTIISLVESSILYGQHVVTT